MVLVVIKCSKRKPRKSTTRTWFPNEDAMQEEAPGGAQEEAPRQFRCQNYGELEHKKNSLKCHLNATRKMQDSPFSP
jgi:hypothetical protein